MRRATQLARLASTTFAVFGLTSAYSQSGPAGQTNPDAAARANKQSGQDASTNPTSDEFVERATQSNLAEIKVSQLALSKTQNADVRSFAQRMIDDHTQANSQLAQLAKAKNLKVPDDTDLMHKASMKLLQTKSGESFDSAYIDQMNKDHQKAIALFKMAAQSNRVDPELKSLATKLLPTLEQHHDQVAQLESKKPPAAASR